MKNEKRRLLPAQVIATSFGVSLSVGLFMSIMFLSSLRLNVKTPQNLLVVDLMQWSEPKKYPQKKSTTLPENPTPKNPLKPKTATSTPKPTPSNIAESQKPVQQTLREVNKEVTSKQIKSIKQAPSINQTIAPNDIIKNKLPIPIPIYQLTQSPTFIHKETPVYPPAMIANGTAGLVKLEVLIDKDGRVRKIDVVKSAGDDFDNAAKTAILASSFNPAKVDKKPVAVVLRLPVKFELL